MLRLNEPPSMFWLVHEVEYVLPGMLTQLPALFLYCSAEV